MNRIVRHLAGAAAALGLAGVLLAAGPVQAGNYFQRGNESASVTPLVTVTIPGRVGIWIQGHPDTLQPGGDYPPRGNFPYWVVSRQFTIKVFSNRASNFKVTLDASGDLSKGLEKSEFHVVTWGGPGSTYTGEGTPQDPANGNSTPPDGWVPLGGQPVYIVGGAGGRTRTTGWESYNAKLALELSGDEVEASNVQVTFTYTISTL